MTTRAYVGYGGKRKTPQSQPIPGEAQVANSAGGFVYALDKWAAFQRFLILGSEGGTYYVREAELTDAAARNTLACIAEDGKRAVDLIATISDAGRAMRNTPAEFALALAASSDEADTRAHALAALPRVCRIGTHLFHFVDFVLKHRGAGRGLRRALASWYTDKTPDDMVYDLVKYQQRDGWAHRDVLRQAHVRPAGRDAIFRWVVGAPSAARTVSRKNAVGPITYPAVDSLPMLIAAFEAAKNASKAELIRLIRDHGLTREMVPTATLSEPDVQEALLEKMPPHALLRNLGNLSKSGLLVPMSDASRTVVEKLSADTDYLRKKRVHPVAVLIAMKVYEQGKGVRGSGSWIPVPAVVDALDGMFYRAFDAIVPTGKRILFGVDVSGSMSSRLSDLPISAAEGAAAMALACAKSESDYHIMGFADTFRDLGITPRMRLDDVLRRTEHQNFGRTDCSLPMRWASTNDVKVDAFVVITDNETWSGDIHPSQALRAYRSETGIDAKQIVIGMTPTEFTIADPLDPLTLDVVGFDASTPQAVSEFIRG
jgi:60 kDa SS-A/Ro ribonucleoprotein